MLRLAANGIALLASLAEHRLLTVPQITTLHFSSTKVARRRLGQLTSEGPIESMPQGPGRDRGRPELVYFLSRQGVDLLRDRSVLPPAVPYDRVTAESIMSCAAHQLLVSWFAIHLGQIHEALPRLRSQFLSPTSPFAASDSSATPTLYDTAKDSDGTTVGFTPDGVFSITDDEQEKTRLFFLEADMGTEPLIAAPGTNGDVRTKVTNYQGNAANKLRVGHQPRQNVLERTHRRHLGPRRPHRQAARINPRQDNGPSIATATREGVGIDSPLFNDSLDGGLSRWRSTEMDEPQGVAGLGPAADPVLMTRAVRWTLLTFRDP